MDERNRPDRDWYRRKIEYMGDLDFGVGPVPQAEIPNAGIGSTTLAFGALVRLERRHKRLSVPQLAQAMHVEEDEIRRIEGDITYRARPRTIIAIAKHFDLPTKKLMKLAGAAIANDDSFRIEAQRFAAKSDDMGALSATERQMLQAFIEFLKSKG